MTIISMCPPPGLGRPEPFADAKVPWTRLDPLPSVVNGSFGEAKRHDKTYAFNPA